jgi:hypothetical protein
MTTSYSTQIITNGSGVAAARSSHERLVLARDDAGKHVRRIVAALDEKEHGDLLNRWVSFIEHKALVVLLRVPDDADAFKMFETLNDRGLRVSQADLIKNFLFSRAGSRMTEVESRWSYMRGALESASDDPDITINFFRHALILQKGHLREADVYDAVQGIVRSETGAATFASALETLANVYVATFTADHERWNGYPDSVRRAIEVFNLFDIKPMRPLILAVASNMDTKQAPLAFRFLVALGVRLVIASSTRSSTVEVPLNDAARDVFAGTIDTATKLGDALTALTPTDGEFRVATGTMKVSNARLARYYLRSLEMTAKGESEPWFVPQGDKHVINLEHILPKKPDAGWPNVTEDDIRQLSTRLGNLALIRATDNSTLRSTAFADKRPVYARSPYVLTSQVAEVEEWAAEAIDARQRKLAELAVLTWPTKV